MRAGWEYKKLGEVCEIFDSQRKPVTKSDRKQGCYPYYGATGIQDYVDSYIFDGRYLLVGEDGAKWSAMERTSYIIEGKSWVNNHAHILQAKEELIDTFLMYYLNCADLDNYISGAIVRKLTQASLKDIQIPLPPIPQQRLIVSELDEINSLIALKREQLKKYDELAQSLFYEMFGDPVENEKGWEVKKLGELCEITSSKRIFAEDYVEHGIPFYRSKEVIERCNNLPISVELFITEQKYQDCKNKYGVPAIGDILITAVGTIGKIWLVNDSSPFYFKDGNLVWLRKINQNLLGSIYFRHVLELLIEEYKKVNANGAAYSALTIVKLKEMQTPLPPLPLQQTFAQRIEQIEEQKKQVTAAIAKLETLLASRMQYWFE